MMKKIALIAPSSPAKELTPETINTIREKLAEADLQIHLGSHALDEMRYLAGSDEDRAKNVMDAFQDESIDMIMTVNQMEKVIHFLIKCFEIHTIKFQNLNHTFHI